MSRPSRREIAAVGAVLLVQLVLLLDGARRDSVTFDEVAFIAGGLGIWQRGDFRLSPESGLLPMALEGALPTLAGIRMPTPVEPWSQSNAWKLGLPLHHLDALVDRRLLLLLARLPIAFVSVGVAAAVHAIARSVLGAAAGFVALVLFAFHPAVLSHGRLATADMAFTATFLAATWLAARCLRRVSPGTVALSCLATAACFLAKFSALLLLPAVGLVALVRLATGAPTIVGRNGVVRSVRGRLAVVAGLVALHAVATVAAIWLAHGARRSPYAQPTGTETLAEGGWPDEAPPGLRSLVHHAHRRGLLPEAWLYGLDHALRHSSSRPAYAFGRWSWTGWWWFFPAVFAVKTPLATLGLLAAGLAAFPLAWRRGRRLTRGDPEGPAWRDDLVALAPFLAPLAVYWCAALAASLNLGVRHLLPTFPATCVLAAAAAAAAGIAGARAARLAVAGLVVLAASEAALAHPLHLAHMNALGGTHAHRWRRFADSSLDWGQDARRVAEWLEAEAEGPAYIAWFGLSDPGTEPVLSRRPLLRLDGRWPGPTPRRLEPGLHVVSATALVRAWDPEPGRWTAAQEEEWRRLDALVEAGAGSGADVLGRHRSLRLARLCAWMRHHEPDHVLGDGAVLAWRLDAAELEEALHGSPVELAPASVRED